MQALGAFGIAFLVWLAVVGVNRALVTVRRGDSTTTVLFDTGLSPDGMITNADRLGVDLSAIQAVVLTIAASGLLPVRVVEVGLLISVVSPTQQTAMTAGILASQLPTPSRRLGQSSHPRATVRGECGCCCPA